MAVREPLEVVFEPPRALRFRPPLSSLLPLADAAALAARWNWRKDLILKLLIGCGWPEREPVATP